MIELDGQLAIGQQKNSINEEALAELFALTADHTSEIKKITFDIEFQRVRIMLVENEVKVIQREIGI